VRNEGEKHGHLTFSRAAEKSLFVTRIRLSRKAKRPASVHTALMSAPERSSFAVMNSSKSTSSPSVIRDVCNLKNRRLVVETADTTENLPEDMAFCLHIREGELNLSVNTTWSNQSGVQRLDSIRGHDNFDVSPCVESVELVEELQHGSLNLAFTT